MIRARGQGGDDEPPLSEVGRILESMPPPERLRGVEGDRATGRRLRGPVLRPGVWPAGAGFRGVSVLSFKVPRGTVIWG